MSNEQREISPAEIQQAVEDINNPPDFRARSQIVITRTIAFALSMVNREARQPLKIEEEELLEGYVNLMNTDEWSEVEPDRRVQIKAQTKGLLTRKMLWG